MPHVIVSLICYPWEYDPLNTVSTYILVRRLAMLTTLDKDLIKRCSLTALTLFLSNVLVTLGSIWLNLYQDAIAFRPSFWGTVLVLLLLLGVICFTVGMQTARLTGEADIGWAISCLACLVAGLATTVVLIGFCFVYFIVISDGFSGCRDINGNINCQFLLLFSLLFVAMFIFLLFL